MATNAELKRENDELKAKLERFTEERLLQCFEDTYAVHKAKLWTAKDYELQRTVWVQIVRKMLSEE